LILEWILVLEWVFNSWIGFGSRMGFSYRLVFCSKALVFGSRLGFSYWIIFSHKPCFIWLLIVKCPESCNLVKKTNAHFQSKCLFLICNVDVSRKILRYSFNLITAERKTSLGKNWHPNCLRCKECGKILSAGQHAEVIQYIDLPLVHQLDRRYHTRLIRLRIILHSPRRASGYQFRCRFYLCYFSFVDIAFFRFKFYIQIWFKPGITISHLIFQHNFSCYYRKCTLCKSPPFLIKKVKHYMTIFAKVSLIKYY